MKSAHTAAWSAAFEWLAAALLALLPVFLLPQTRASKLIFNLLFLWGLACLLAPGKKRDWEYYWRGTGALGLGFILWPVALASHQVAKGLPLDPRYMFTVFAGLFVLAWGLARLGTRKLAWMSWGCAAAAFYAAVWAHFATLEGRPDHVGMNNIILFSNMALLMGALAAISTGWDAPTNFLAHGVKLAAFCAGIYVAYVGQTRGSWLAVPLLIGVACASYRHVSPRLRIIAFVALIIAGATVAASSQMVRERVNESLVALTGQQQGFSSSMGRIQVWQASLRMFAAHPWTGVGDDFRNELRAQARAGLILPEVSEDLPHAHNDMLFAMAMYGIPGLIATLALYLAPAVYFGRRLRSRDPHTACAAVMGVTTVAAFFLFGLPDIMFVMFGLPLTNIFYVTVMAWLIAVTVCRQRALLQSLV